VAQVFGFFCHANMITPRPAGRIWRFCFGIGIGGEWLILLGLSSPSIPACPSFSFWIEDDREPGRKLHYKKDNKFYETLVPDE